MEMATIQMTHVRFFRVAFSFSSCETTAELSPAGFYGNKTDAHTNSIARIS